MGLLLLFFAVFLLWPIGQVVATGFLSKDGGFTLSYVRLIFRDPMLVRGLINAAMIAGAVTGVSLLIALPLASLSVRYEFPGRALLTGLLLVPLVLPPFVGALGMRLVLSRFGPLTQLVGGGGPMGIDWLGHYRILGIILIEALHLYPIMLLNIQAAMANVDPAMEQAAANMGASRWTIFRRITLPLIRPGLFAGCTLVLIWSFLEGPTWLDWNGGFLVFSDIPANRIMKWTPKAGLTVFRENSHGANGNIADPQGRMVTCEEGIGRVTMTDKNGALTILAERSADGLRLSSPNDVAIQSDGTVWFTDPPYGLPRDQKKEQPGNYVFRFDPKTKQAKPVLLDFDMPNGICFSPDQKTLYVADSGKPHHIRAFDLREDGTLANSRIFCVIDKGGPDGIRCDSAGRIWSSAADGIHIFSPDGSLIGKILVPESPSNLCFGGPDAQTLFITARTSLYAIKLTAPNATK